MDTESDIVDEIECGTIDGELSAGGDHMTFGPFAMTDEGLTKNIVGGRNNSKVSKTVEISAPFEVLGYCRDGKGSAWGKTIRFSDADGREHIHHVAEALLHGDPAKLAGELGVKGLRIDRKWQKDFAEAAYP